MLGKIHNPCFSIYKIRLVGGCGFYGISTFVGYLMPNSFLYKLFYFKQFSLAWVHSLIVKTFLFQAIKFIQTILIQFSISVDFLYTITCQNSFILNNSV